MKKERMNKKAQGATWNNVLGAIVIIGLLLIIFLMIMGVIPGPMEWFENVGGGEENLQAVITGCNTACESGSKYDYCTRKRKVVFDKNKENPDNREWTCVELAKSGKATGLDLCTNFQCEIQEQSCSELKDDLCGNNDKCIVKWVGIKTYERYEREDVGEEKNWASIEEVSSSYISEEDKQAHKDEICMKGILN